MNDPDPILRGLGFEGAGAQLPSVPAGTVALLVAFFLLGFLLYAAIFAAVAAATNSMEEAEQILPAVQIPLFIPMMFAFKVGEDPLGTAATVLGLIPFTAPMTMPMRLVATTVPAWQVAASLASVVIGTAVIAWIAGKIYRVGILSTGTKPTLPRARPVAPYGLTPPRTGPGPCPGRGPRLGRLRRAGAPDPRAAAAA